jgi:hypothetical protein
MKREKSQLISIDTVLKRYGARFERDEPDDLDNGSFDLADHS